MTPASQLRREAINNPYPDKPEPARSLPETIISIQINDGWGKARAERTHARLDADGRKAALTKGSLAQRYHQ
jgi:hypothetical protein